MFFATNSSSNTKNGHDPFCNLSNPDHSFHLPISFFPFPSPFEVDEEYDNDHHDHDLFHEPLNFTVNSSSSQNNPPISTNNTPSLDQILPTNTTMGMMMKNSDQKKMKKILPRKRLSKKDRHSKITTARGVRDRRMRLSLPVARQFFGLQDMLGVDKGSKTVEWLLIQAKPEILKLAKERNRLCDVSNSASNSSEPDHMMSGIDEVRVIVGDNNHQNLNTKDNNIKIKKKKKMMMRAKQQPRKVMAKELREKARERARARTLEKKNQINIRDSCSDHHHPNFTKVSSSSWSSPFETTGGEESAGTQSYNNLNLAIEVEKPITSQFDYPFDQNFSSFDIIMPKWSPSDDLTFNFLHQQHEFENSDILG